MLVRTHQGTRWTQAGEALVGALQPVSALVDSALRSAHATGNSLTGNVRLSAVEGLSHAVLQALAVFRGRYPRVGVTVDWSHQPMDVLGHEVDIGLRTIKPKAQGLVLRQLVKFEFGLYAAANAALPRGPGARTAWLGQQSAVCLGQELQGLRENQWVRERVPKVALWVPNLTAQLHAVALGLGVAALPDPLARQDTRLRRLGSTDPTLDRVLWLAMGKTAAKSEPVRALADVLTHSLREQGVA